MGARCRLVPSAPTQAPNRPKRHGDPWERHEMSETRLWESDHPYYCTGGCFFTNDGRCWMEHDSWADFMEDGMGQSDHDYNMLMRWDWHEGEEHDIPDGAAELKLFFFLQRKAYPVSVTVKVNRAEEPQIREWLAKRWEHTKRLWAPFSDAVAP